MADYTAFLKDIRQHPHWLRAQAEWPAESDAHRTRLNQSIVGVYFMREIGFETVELFCQQFTARMGVIMPMYNKLYRATDLDYPILSGIDVETTSADNSSSESTSLDTGTNKSDTSGRSTADSFAYPQSQIRANGQHMTSRTNTDSTNTSEATQATQNESASKGNSVTLGSVKGRSQSAASLVAEYFAVIRNVDAEVIEDISDLFMGTFKA